MKVREVCISYKRPRKMQSTIKDSAQAAPLFRRLLPDNSREHFMALYLDGAHQPIAYRVVSSGLQNSSQVHPREVLQPALMVGAVSMIVAHNHPSGNTTPSEQDRRVTEAIRDSAKLVGISLLDHLIITEKEHHSFQEQGMI